MKKIISIFIAAALILATGCSLAKGPSKQQGSSVVNSNNSSQDSKSEEPKNSSNQNNTPQANDTSKPASEDTKKTSMDVLIYLIALEDNGKSGKKLPTGDSIIQVKRTLSDSKAPLKDTLSLLFSLKDRFYGQSGLYNALYQSDLKVDSAKIENGIATVNITGNLKLGGTLDSPRVKYQILETILQFSNVKEAKVFLNGKPIDEALSQK